jgi:outer membrane protein, heavy metal efflux system
MKGGFMEIRGDKSRRGAALIFFFLFFAPGPASAEMTAPISGPAELSALIEEGLAKNGEIQSLQAQEESFRAEVSFAGALDDPRLGIGVLNLPTDTFSFNQEPMTQKQIFVAQKFPWFGKLDLRSRRTLLKAIRQQSLLEAKRLELAKKIADAYYDLGYTDRGLEINNRLYEVVTQLLRFAEMRYSTGRGLQQDVLQAQVELSKLIDERITLERTRRTLEDRINELLNRESFEAVKPVDVPISVDLSLPVNQLQDRALTHNPWLGVQQAEIDAAAVDIELAHKDYWPDMDLALAYGQRDEDSSGRHLPDFVSATVSINIPLWQKYRQDSKLEATLKSRDAAVKSYRNLLQSLPHRVDALVSEMRKLQESQRLFADALVFQADQWAKSSQAAYETGAVEFNTMLNARIRYLRFELQAQSYLYQVDKKLAELEEVLGGKL